VDSKRERAGGFWEWGSVVVSLHTHSCAHMFMFSFMWGNGRVGEQQKGRYACNSCKWGGVSKLVTHVQERVLFHAGKWMGRGTGKGRPPPPKKCRMCHFGVCRLQKRYNFSKLTTC
jgi:hypothetical protein